jgi:hypothetical protein
MAFLRKFIDKNTFLMISGVWVACSSYLTSMIHDPPLQVLIITAGTIIINWIGVETANSKDTGQQIDNKANP